MSTTTLEMNADMKPQSQLAPLVSLPRVLGGKVPPEKPPRLHSSKAVEKVEDDEEIQQQQNYLNDNQLFKNINDLTTTSITTTTTTTTINIDNDQMKVTIQQPEQKKQIRVKKKHLQFQSPLATTATNFPNKYIHDDDTTNSTTTTTTTTLSSSQGTVMYTMARRRNHTKTTTTTTTSVAAATATVSTTTLTMLKQRLTHGCTSLMYACQHGDIVEVLEQLRSKPDSIHQRDSHNKNVLHYCAAQNTGQTSRDLVAAASIAIAAPELLGSADEDGFTPLHLAVIQGNLAMVNLLLANKADVNAVDNEGHSVVHWATVCGEVEALRSVLSAGGNVATPDVNGGTPLHYAAQMCGATYEGKLGHVNSTKLALEILDILLTHPQTSVDVQDKDGRQPLLWAASAGSAKAVLALVKAGSRVECSDKDGLTALHCAASRGHTECIDTLIGLCGAPTDLIDSNGCTSLHYAVTLGHADATSRLLDHDADPNRQDRKGRTPAHCGCSKGQFETVKLLKERGANLWLRNAKGDLPVHEAAASGRLELVQWLLEQRPKQVNTTSNDGRSLLHIAAANNYTDICKFLLDIGADVNGIYRNSKGVVITPLDCAMHKGHRSTAKFIQSNGGLPAGKLRLAARRTNPFQDVSSDIVRPLKYAEKEELYDLQNSKKYVVYLKRSDSDGGADGNCSCTEQTYRREQRIAHTCRRHQRTRKPSIRRRTSSCGEPKESCRCGDSHDICRSKSNIEIRRRKSRERYLTSSESGDDDNAEDSCENCCYHKRQKQRVIRRRSISSKRSRDLKYTDDDDGDEDDRGRARELSQEKRGKRLTDTDFASGKDGGTDEIVQEKVEKDAAAISRPGSKTSQRSRPQSASKRQAPSTATKEGTFIRSPPQSALADSKFNSNELTDEDDSKSKDVQVVTTKVDVHRDADAVSLKLSQEAEGDESKKATDNDNGERNLEAEVTEEVKKTVDEVLQTASTAAENDSQNGTAAEKQSIDAEEQKLIVSSVKEGEKEGEKENAQSVNKIASVEVEDKTKDTAIAQSGTILQTPNLIETPATPMPTPTPSPPPTSANASQATPVQTSQVEQSDKTQNLQGSIENAKTPAESTAAAIEETTDTTSKADIPSTQKQSETEHGVDVPTTASKDENPPLREQESRRSFTLLPSDSAEDEEVEQPVRKSSFQVLKSDESNANEDVEFSDSQVFKIVHDDHDTKVGSDAEMSSGHEEDEPNVGYEDEAGVASSSPLRQSADGPHRHGVGAVETDAVLGMYDYSNGRRRRLKKRVRSGAKTRSNWKNAQEAREEAGVTVVQQSSKDQDSGFEPSPRNLRSKIPTPRHIYTAHVPRRPIYTTLDGRSCSSRLENRKPGDKGACDMSAVTRSIQRNIRRYYMERKIFQHLLELKSLQIRSNKLNEAVLVKRAVDDYHKSCDALGGETGTRLRRYTFSEYTFKNFELFLYETLKSLQKPGTFNFQNINEVYEEAERRLSPDYNAYEKALQCTTKTHRCLHAAHAYTGIPCAAYIPMMNHHTMPKFGFGPYKKTGVGSFYLPKILTSSTVGGCSGGKVALELSHGKSKQVISLPSEKLDSNKRYYVTFTVKESGGGLSGAGTSAPAAGVGTGAMNKQQQQQQQQAGDASGK